MPAINILLPAIGTVSPEGTGGRHHAAAYHHGVVACCDAWWEVHPHCRGHDSLASAVAVADWMVLASVVYAAADYDDGEVEG